MDISQPSFKCDETPTPTRFIRNCEEVGLFQDLQNNPFEETFRIAVETNTTQTLPEPLSKHANADTLDTPQVVPNSKRIEDYRNQYSISEDDDDIIKIHNNDFFILSNDDDVPLENTPLIRNIELNENQNNEQVTRQNDKLGSDVIEIDLTTSPMLERSSEQTNNSKPCPMALEESYNLKPPSYQNEIIEEIFLGEQEIMTDNSITNEFLVLHNRNESKENSYSFTMHTNENVIFIPSKNNTQTDNPPTKTSSKPSSSELSIKQKLKSLLKPFENNVVVTQPTPSVIQRNTSTTSTYPDDGSGTCNDKLSYSRERNREAQKRCRQKKKKFITELKKETESIYNENKSLRAENISLKAEIAQLKTLLLAHKNCPVTKAMYQANSSKVAPSANAKGSPTTYSVVSPVAGSQKYHLIRPKATQNETPNSKTFSIPQLNPIQTLVVKPKLHTAERKHSLKVIIDENTIKSNSKPIVNSPNAVNVICYNQNQAIGVTEITDLTCDSS